MTQHIYTRAELCGSALGCLLAQQFGIELRRVGSGKQMTFGGGEQTLSNWMSENAFVCWVEHPAPWQIESALIPRTLPAAEPR